MDEEDFLNPTDSPMPRDLDEAYSMNSHIKDALDPSKVDGIPGDPLDFSRVGADGGELAASSQDDMNSFGDMLDIPDAPGEVELQGTREPDAGIQSDLPKDLASPLTRQEPSPQSQVHARAAQERIARQARIAMNQTRAMLPKPGRATEQSVDNDEFTFPAQETDNDNAGEKWGDLHRANASFREAVITNAEVEAGLLQEHTARIKSITESLIRSRY